MNPADTHRQTAADLQAAAAYIERNGWSPGDLGNGSAPTCVTNAIYWTASSDRRMLHAQAVVGTHLGLQAAGPLPDLHAIWRWNDAGGRQKAEVLDALQGAAKDQLRLADDLDAADLSPP